MKNQLQSSDKFWYSSPRLFSKTFQLYFFSENYLEKKAADMKKLGVEKTVCVSREGHSADEIIKRARETPDTLISMCSHGRSGVGRWVLGSVTETVVRHADNPVLILRPAIPVSG